jgi:hypothetical protein
MEIVYKWLEGDPDLTPPEPIEKPEGRLEAEWEARFTRLLLLKRDDGSLIYPRSTYVRDGAWVCPSTSRPGVEHHVYLRDGQLCCTCEAWLARERCKQTLLPEYVARSFTFSELPNMVVAESDICTLWFCYAGGDYASRIWEVRVYQYNKLIARHFMPDWYVRRMRWRYSGEPTWLVHRYRARAKKRFPRGYEPFEEVSAAAPDGGA